MTCPVVYEGIEYPGYRVSFEGFVVGPKSPRLKTKMRGSRGGRYPAVDLWKDREIKTVYVHRLVATAFLPNPENKEEVHHIDGDKCNAHGSNLLWVTRGENERYKKEGI